MKTFVFYLNLPKKHPSDEKLTHQKDTGSRTFSDASFARSCHPPWDPDFLT